MGFYDQSVTAANGEEISMKDYEGKVVLVVNTATGCGFTPHYKDIESMYEKYHDKGFEVIDVPCNQFAGQTPGTDEEIHEFCTLKYKTQFPQMKKTDVNGENATPLFKYLKSQKGFEGFGKGPAALAMGVISPSSLWTGAVMLLQDSSQQLKWKRWISLSPDCCDKILKSTMI
jgi:glutathione peroxidase